MKRIGLFLIAILVGTAFSSAQPGTDRRNFDPEEMAKRQTAQLDEVLDLTGDQEKQVYGLMLETRTKMRELREKNRSGGGGFEGMREEFGKIREEENAKMKEILTEDQWAKYEKYMEERRARWNERRPPRRR